MIQLLNIYGKMNKDVDKTIYNSFEQELIDSRYKIFKSVFNNSIRGFQKRFDNEIGKKYFITVWHWNHGKQHPEWENAPDKNTYEFDLQFKVNKYEKELTVNLTIWGKNLPDDYGENIISLKETEEFIDKTWNSMGCPYYETWEEG